MPRRLRALDVIHRSWANDDRGRGIQIGVGAEADQRHVVVECQRPCLHGGVSLLQDTLGIGST